MHTWQSSRAPRGLNKLKNLAKQCKTKGVVISDLADSDALMKQAGDSIKAWKKLLQQVPEAKKADVKQLEDQVKGADAVRNHEVHCLVYIP